MWSLLSQMIRDNLILRISLTCSESMDKITWFYLANLLLRNEDTLSKRARLSGIFEPETIAEPQVFECFSHDAAENRADHTAGQRPFRDASWPQVEIVRVLIGLHVHVKRFVGEGSGQVVPASCSTKSAEFAVGIVGRDTVIAAALNV